MQHISFKYLDICAVGVSVRGVLLVELTQVLGAAFVLSIYDWLLLLGDGSLRLLALLYGY
jgi:hypothetical protein